MWRGAALKLAHDFGGRDVYIPERFRPDHPIVQALGPDGARVLTEMFGSGDLLIPLGRMSNYARRTEAVVKALQDGKSVSAAAGAIGVHKRTVQRVRKKLRRGDQPDLFSDD